MKHIITIMQKQMKDTLKNKTVLIQFIMFPLLGIIMTKSMQIEGMPENFFVNLFSTMYIGMAPLTSVSAIISEEKEKNTLRVLLMAKVSPMQYLIGIGSYVFLACMFGSVIFSVLLQNVTTSHRIIFLLIMALGIITSIMIGGVIGIISKNQMAATSVTVPVMMIFSFLPMLSIFNDKIAKIAQFTYSEQIRLLINSLQDSGDYIKNITVIVVNIVIFCLILYRQMRTSALR